MSTMNFQPITPRLRPSIDEIVMRSSNNTNNSGAAANYAGDAADLAARALLYVKQTNPPTQYSLSHHQNLLLQQQQTPIQTTVPPPSSSAFTAPASPSPFVTPNSSSTNLQAQHALALYAQARLERQLLEQQHQQQHQQHEELFHVQQRILKRRFLAQQIQEEILAQTTAIEERRKQFQDLQQPQRDDTTSEDAAEDSSSYSTPSSSPGTRPLKKRKMMESLSFPDSAISDGVSPRSLEILQRIKDAQLQERKQQEETSAVAAIAADDASAARAQLTAKNRLLASTLASVSKTSSNDDIRTRKTKALAAKLRSKNASARMMIRPSDYARTVFMKNMCATVASNDNNSVASRPLMLKSKIDEYRRTFHTTSAIDIEIYENHSTELYGYIRRGTDLDGFKACVRRLQSQYPSQRVFRCCNKFGESLLHLACRRGQTDMVRFLLESSSSSSPLPMKRIVSPTTTPSNNEQEEEEEETDYRTKNTTSFSGQPSSHYEYARDMLTIRDDYNKTPFHDACWTATPNFELIDLLLKYAPIQILVEDIRGNTPFDYVPKENYPQWLKFLWERKSYLRC